jgi:hypothetical protein
MKVIKPITFSTSMLLSTNATETVAVWVIGTPYPKDAEVNYANSIYVSIQPSNTGKQPDTNPEWWIRKSSNNTYSMFDEFVNTQTTRNSNLTVTVQPNAIFNSIAVFNISGANTLQVTVKDGVSGPTVYDSGMLSLDDTIIVDWYMYFFEPYDLKSDIILQGIPPYSTGVITASFSGGSAVAVGNFIFGIIYDIGQTQYGANAGIRDYSTKDPNAFGITSLVKRAFSKRMNANLYVSNGDIRFVRKLLEDLRATPAVWVGTDDDTYDVLNVYGYYKDFNMEISYPSYSLCSLEIEGLI